MSILPTKPLPKRSFNQSSTGLEIFTNCRVCGGVLTRGHTHFCSDACSAIHLDTITGIHAYRAAMTKESSR